MCTILRIKSLGFIAVVLGRSIKNYTEDRGTQMAASISYYALFSLVPLIVLAVAIFGIVLRNTVLQEKSISRVLFLIVCFSRLKLKPYPKAVDTSQLSYHWAIRPSGSQIHYWLTLVRIPAPAELEPARLVTPISEEVPEHHLQRAKPTDAVERLGGDAAARVGGFSNNSRKDIAR